MIRRITLIAAALAALPTLVQAQGSVSTQSLGYPPGQLSTRAQGTGGAIAEIDGRSPINPAALAVVPDAYLYAQYDPEFRTVATSNGTANTTVARFPNVAGAMPLGRRIVVGVSASTLLDRTWETSVSRKLATPDTLAATERLRSEGGIEDLRLGAGWEATRWLRVGLAAHGFTGSTRVTANESFGDTLRFRNITQIADLSYSGAALSAGVEIDLLPKLNLAVSGRKGGHATLFAGDTALTRAHVPDRYSASLSFEGLPGTLLAVRYAKDMWSQIGALSTVNAAAVDATEMSAGLESAGPRIGGFPLLVRLGVRRRDLPFPVDGATVKETSFGGGLGIPVAYDRVTFDISALRSSRTGVAGVDEHAYNLSFGLRVRP